VSDATIYKGCSKYGGMDVSEAKQMNRTIKDAAIKRFHYDSLEQLRRHLQGSIGAHTFSRDKERSKISRRTNSSADDGLTTGSTHFSIQSSKCRD
jgi:hypothetical protein